MKKSLLSFCKLESAALSQRQKLLNDLKEAVEVMDCHYDVTLFIENEKKSDVSHKFCKALNLLDADFRNRIQVHNENEKMKKRDAIENNDMKSAAETDEKIELKIDTSNRIKNYEDENDNSHNHYYSNQNEYQDDNENDHESENEVKTMMESICTDRSSFNGTPNEAAEPSLASNQISNFIDSSGFQSQLFSLLQLDFSDRKDSNTLTIDENDKGICKNNLEQRDKDNGYEYKNITNMIQTEYTVSKLFNEQRKNENLRKKDNDIEQKSPVYDRPIPLGHSPVMLSPSRSGSGSGTALSKGFSRLRPNHGSQTNTHTGAHTNINMNMNMKSSFNTSNSNSNSNSNRSSSSSNVTTMKEPCNGADGSWESALKAAQASQSDEVPYLLAAFSACMPSVDYYDDLSFPSTILHSLPPSLPSSHPHPLRPPLLLLLLFNSLSLSPSPLPLAKLSWTFFNIIMSIDIHYCHPPTLSRSYVHCIHPFLISIN